MSREVFKKSQAVADRSQCSRHGCADVTQHFSDEGFLLGLINLFRMWCVRHLESPFRKGSFVPVRFYWLFEFTRTRVFKSRRWNVCRHRHSDWIFTRKSWDKTATERVYKRLIARR